MNEKQLIFLISQPRSGSTLIQRLLGAHSKIYTRSESWIMLGPAYSLRNNGIDTEYDFHLYRQALDEFCRELPNGEQTYIEELQKMYLNLYSKYITNTGNKYFLDKTPRYYLIVNELLQIFPKAKYILLIRNPLAVLGSIINSWTKDDWSQLHKFRHDLFDVIDIYVDTVTNNKNILVVHYENLLKDNEKFLNNIFKYLGLENEKVSEKYYNNSEKWKFGDQINVYNNKGIDSSNDNKWQRNLNNPQYWRVMYDYLNYIGKERLEKIGYDFEDQRVMLEGNMPSKNLDEIIKKTTSLEKLLDKDDNLFIENEQKQQLSTTQTELNTTKQQLSTTQTELNTTKQQLSTTQTELNTTKQQLNNVCNSREWRMIVKLQRIFKIFFPVNSLRRKILIKCVNCVKKIIRLTKRIKTLIIIFIKNNYHKLKPGKKRQINKNAKKLVYVGHSYHNKTRSTIFLQNYLKEFFDVEIISDYSWQGKKYPDLSFINNEEYAGVVFFQLLPPRDVLNKIKNDNIMFCPMYDQSGRLDFNFWNQYRDLKIINFSSTLHKKLKKWGFESINVQYFPKVHDFIPGKKDEVFFWQRLTKINFKTIMKLLGKQNIKIHLHKAVDPNQKFIKPADNEEKIYKVTYSKWFDTREEMQEIIKQKGIYVAPREYEGIGQSFLEAMAMGKAVIAVDNPTMNEYIKHNETGYLFDSQNPQEIDLSNIAQVQKNTYNYMVNGRKKWKKDRKNIIEFIKKD